MSTQTPFRGPVVDTPDERWRGWIGGPVVGGRGTPRRRLPRTAGSRPFSFRRLLRRAVLLVAPPLALLLLLAAGLVHHVYFDRSGLPDLEPFIRFEPPTIGRGLRRPRQGADRAGARVPPGRLLRRGAPHPAPGHPGGRGQELLLPLRRGLPRAAAGGPEDRGALPGRLVEGRLGSGCASPRAARRSRSSSSAATSSRTGRAARTATVALPRRPDLAAPLRGPGCSAPRTSSSGSWRRCAWRSGSRRRCAGATDRRSRPSARSSPATPASSTWATAATASPPPPSTTSASRCRATRRRTRGRRRCWRGSASRPGTTPRCPATRGPCAAATRSWP